MHRLRVPVALGPAINPWCSMYGVKGATWKGAAVLALAVAMLTFPTVASAESRLMIGESFVVGADESLESAICVACSIRVEGTVTGAGIVILGRLENNGTIEDGVGVVFGEIQSNGRIGEGAFVITGKLTLRDKLPGDVLLIDGTLDLGDPNAGVGGQVVAVGGQVLGASASSVTGGINQVGGRAFGRWLAGVTGAALLALFLIVLAALEIVNVVAYLVLGTKRLTTIADTFTGGLASCFLVGLGTCFALFVTALMVAMLLPVSLPALFVLAVLTVVGYCGLTFGIGRNLFGRFKPLTATLMATAMIVFIQMIPGIGWLMMAIVWNIAIGAAVMSGFGTSTDWLAIRADGDALRSRSVS